MGDDEEEAHRENESRDDSESDDEEEDDEDDDDDDDDVTAPPVEGAYDPAEFESLDVSPEVQELFSHIMRYTPQVKL